MLKPLVVVTGKNGQLGWELQQLVAHVETAFDFFFTGREELDLSNPEMISAFFQKYKPAYFINCAAYTAVDKAESEQEFTYTVNASSVGLLATECSKLNCPFITISTDYVFDGKGTAPYAIDHLADPVNYYGYTKWMGEKLALANNPHTIVIRTSWVYSSHGNNFVKTMLRLMKEKEELKVVNDQIGSPTYAADLASAILQIITRLAAGNAHYGIYQFSNEGQISWYDFAVAIRTLGGLSCMVLPIPTKDFPTPAKRPAYSVMDTQQIVRDFGVPLKNWKESLVQCISKLS
ncbi:MAG: dTDP-4-dehydrorhamnose reductase [Chitinophagaceae bacterium]|nr:MAG: dTDP-4-dehydrorhamnose reductase [Chitinophagaceae bacterium]